MLVERLFPGMITPKLNRCVSANSQFSSPGIASAETVYETPSPDQKTERIFPSVSSFDPELPERQPDRLCNNDSVTPVNFENSHDEMPSNELSSSSPEADLVCDELPLCERTNRMDTASTLPLLGSECESVFLARAQDLLPAKNDLSSLLVDQTFNADCEDAEEIVSKF